MPAKHHPCEWCHRVATFRLSVGGHRYVRYGCRDHVSAVERLAELDAPRGHVLRSHAGPFPLPEAEAESERGA